jgi:hypothetical protein
MRIDSQDVRIPIGEIELEGELAFPVPAAGLVTRFAAVHVKEAS